MSASVFLMMTDAVFESTRLSAEMYPDYNIIYALISYYMKLIYLFTCMYNIKYIINIHTGCCC